MQHPRWQTFIRDFYNLYTQKEMKTSKDKTPTEKYFAMGHQDWELRQIPELKLLEWHMTYIDINPTESCHKIAHVFTDKYLKIHFTIAWKPNASKSLQGRYPNTYVFSIKR